MAQIGTIQIETQNSGTVDLPVYEIGDFGNSIYSYVRVQTASGVGAIPITDPSVASYDFLRVQTNSHGVTAAHHCPVDKDSTYPVSEGFEDGDINDWTIVTEQTGTSEDPTIEVTTDAPHSGSYNLNVYYPTQSETDSGSSEQELFLPFESTTTSGEYLFWCRRRGGTGSSQDDFRVRWNGLGGNWAQWNLNREQSVGDGRIYINSTDTDITMSTGLTNEYKTFILRNVDFFNETFDWEILDALGATLAAGTAEPFRESACTCDEFEISTPAFNDDAAEFWFDDIEIVAP